MSMIPPFYLSWLRAEPEDPGNGQMALMDSPEGENVGLKCLRVALVLGNSADGTNR